MITDVTRADSFFKRGLYYYERAKWEEAVSNLRDAVDIYPEHHMSRLYLGASMAQQKLFVEAIQLLEEGRQKPSVDDTLHFRYTRLLGAICLWRKDNPAAVYYLKIAHELCPGDHELAQVYASACCKAGQFREGFDLFLETQKLFAPRERS